MDLTESLAAFVAIGALLAVLGTGFSRLIYGTGPHAGHKGWKGVWYVTMWLHPVIAGALIGWLLDLPVPWATTPPVAGRVIWYALSGGFAPTLYNAVNNYIKQRAQKE